MKHIFLLFFLVVALLSGLLYKLNQEKTVESEVKTLAPSGRILQYGTYKLIRGGKVLKSDITSTGKAVSRPVLQKIKQTKMIAIDKNVYFAYQYRLSNLAKKQGIIKLKRVLNHPEITLPDGRKVSHSEYMIKGKVRQGEVFAFDGYALNEDYEMVEGDWTFQIWYQGKKLAEQMFTTYYSDK